MTNRMKLIAVGFVSALVLTVAAPLTAQAGTLKIFNANCTTQKGFEVYNRVTVKIDAKSGAGCTHKKVNVHKGQLKTIQLAAKGEDGKDCGDYRYVAIGQLQDEHGKYDVPGDGDSSVTCRKDRSTTCQCTKN